MYRNILERFYSKIKNNRWTGSKVGKYGWFFVGCNRRGLRVGIAPHIFSFILHNKTMPKGEIHHICEDKLCVDPEHLVDKSKAEHRSIHKTKKICVNGHEIAIVGRTKHGDCKACLILWRENHICVRINGKKIYYEKELKGEKR